MIVSKLRIPAATSRVVTLLHVPLQPALMLNSYLVASVGWTAQLRFTTLVLTLIERRDVN
jgi:hypothetical protein